MTLITQHLPKPICFEKFINSYLIPIIISGLVCEESLYLLPSAEILPNATVLLLLDVEGFLRDEDATRRHHTLLL